MAVIGARVLGAIGVVVYWWYKTTRQIDVSGPTF